MASLFSGPVELGEAGHREDLVDLRSYIVEDEFAPYGSQFLVQCDELAEALHGVGAESRGCEPYFGHGA